MIYSIIYTCAVTHQNVLGEKILSQYVFLLSNVYAINVWPIWPFYESTHNSQQLQQQWL